ncbi:Threonine/homoserine efflux transporter RhtA [Parapedobacter luteus]|uniref:Threonine/homoserine efflux transporter RhtA n=2 Tax=Parapedobacter TaxID=416949 RepID=A0A1T5ESG0_9SPHI|nr:EamA family transporter [Parapedobacter luteus]SKB86748.1 Threonine/homoserine efflux transporter RhtA [Parapedobacter luteus]
MKKTYLLLHTAVLFLGFSPVFGKLISLNEGLLTWYRVFFSAVILFFALKLFRVNKNIGRKEKFNIAKIGILLTLSWVFFFAGIKYSNISIGVVCYCMASFFTAILEPLVNKTPFRLSEFLLSALTIVGIGLIFHFDTSYQLGISLGVISPFFYTLYSVYNKRLVEHYDSKLINYYQMIGGTVGLGVSLPVYLYFFPSENLIPDFRDSSYLLMLALFCTVLVYVFLTEAFKKISAFTANLSMNLEPVYAIIVAFLFFGESKEVNFSFYIGLVFVISSVVLQTFIINKE